MPRAVLKNGVIYPVEPLLTKDKDFQATPEIESQNWLT
jgi:hypothetical protein